MSWLTKIFSIFTSDKAKKALETAASISEIATPIVAQIAYLTPNRTDDEIMAAYAKYGVPFFGVVRNDPNGIGNALLNLGTQAVTARLPAQYLGIATSTIQTAVQIAVTARKAG